MVGAVVLAAGAATRFGAPKQRLLPPAVLEHVRGLDQVVVVAGAYPLEGAIDCPDWERGPGASLRCGLAALGPEVEAAVVAADGPSLAPAAIDRGRGVARRRERRSSPSAAATAPTRSSSRGPRGATSRRGSREVRAEARSVRRPRRARRRRLSARSAGEVQSGATNRCRRQWSLRQPLPQSLEVVSSRSALTTARLQRRLTGRAAAKRAGLTPDQVEWLEEGRVYRFPSTDHAIEATLLLAAALEIGLARRAGWPATGRAAPTRRQPARAACRRRGSRRR